MADTASATRPYELMVLFSPELNEESLESAMERVNRTLESANVTVDNAKTTTPWGRRRLAYPIQRFRDAFYVLYDISCPPEFSNDIERELRINEQVIRYLLVHKVEDPEETEAEKTAEAEDALVDQADSASESAAPETTAPAAESEESTETEETVETEESAESDATTDEESPA